VKASGELGTDNPDLELSPHQLLLPRPFLLSRLYLFSSSQSHNITHLCIASLDIGQLPETDDLDQREKKLNNGVYETDILDAQRQRSAVLDQDAHARV
jgi:hypothetical protein